ncbi:MAG: DNA repair protein RecO [Firmicutes bacterium]|nr:DNA repair protein RecO [Bacillota bacterium]
MYTETEGIILKQTKTLNGRKMIVLFSQKYGKISAGTSISERGKNKSSLAIRPFCRGRYELFKNRDTYNINGAEALESFYSLGEDIDKFMAASRILELTDVITQEDQPQPALYSLLCEYLSMMSLRKGSYGTLDAGFQIKAFQLEGCGIRVNKCVRCGKARGEEDTVLSVQEGGLVCAGCHGQSIGDPLIFTLSNDMISIIDYISGHPLKSLEKLEIPAQTDGRLRPLLQAWLSCHLGVDRLKSDELWSLQKGKEI